MEEREEMVVVVVVAAAAAVTWLWLLGRVEVELLLGFAIVEI